MGMILTGAGTLLLRGLLLGLGAAVPIGPVNVEIARRTLRGGFLAGFAIGCGAVSVDIAYALLTSMSMKPILTRPGFRWPLQAGGVALLTYLGILCLIGAYRAARTDPLQSAPPRPSLHGGYLTGVLMTLLNPMTLAFWFVVVPGTLGTITDHPGRDLPIICAGVFVGTLGWVVSFAGLLSLLGRFRRQWWLVAADVLGGIILLVFAAITAFAFGTTTFIMPAN